MPATARLQTAQAKAEMEWIQVHTANVEIGDVVRVKKNAYSGSTGAIHNGRLCEVIEVRKGDVIVKSIDDALPKLTSTFHPPYNLEKMVIK